jgi:surface antigen
MARKLITVMITAVAFAATGCATNGVGQNEQSGAIVGGVLGGLLGTQVGKGDGRTAAIIAGTLIGATIGGAVGRSMDANDRIHAAQSLEGVRTGVPTVWQNPDTGYQYQFTPTRTYETGAGPCREYTMVASIGGQNETVYGTACRQPDGSWRVMP